jgi:ATP-binding cassette, subfamily B, beta-glucan exporter
VREADEILVFDSGRIVERGTFQSLLARGGRFADLVQTQLAPAPLAAMAAE